jgi:hypothetical protein
MVISDISSYKDGYLFTLNTDEDVKGNKFSSDHYVSITKDVSKTARNIKNNDLVLVEGLAVGDKFVRATKFINASEVFQRKPLSESVRHRNHLTIHATVTKDHHRGRNGYVLFAQTDVKIGKEIVTTVHEIFAGDHLEEKILQTKPGDLLIIEGPLSRERRIIVLHFTNLTSAFRSRGDNKSVHAAVTRTAAGR